MSTVPRIRSIARPWLRFTVAACPAPGAWLLCAALALSGGCGNEKPAAGGANRDGVVPDGAAADGGTDAGASVALPTALAILASDYKVTTVSLYDPVSGQLTEGCVHTGASGASLAQPLSGDVALPSQPQQGGELRLIDRKNSVVTFVDPTSCVPRAQLSVSTGGFKANPRDIISVSAHKAYVTRYESNPTPTDDPSDFDEGNDLLVIDPLVVGSAQAAILGRLPLVDYATSVDGVTILARPDRGIFANGKVYVTLGNLSVKFVPGPGRVVVIDPATDAVTDVVDLPNWKECSGIEYVAATNRIYVSCWGSPNDADQAATSALVEIDVSGERAAIGRVVPASKIGNLPINFSYAAVIGETAFVGTFGVSDFKTGAVITPDAFQAVSLATVTATKLLDGGAYNFGRAAVDPVGMKVFLPDGDAVAPRVHVFDASGAVPVASGMFEPDTAGHLAPREIAWY